MDLFTPVVPEARWHPVFKMIVEGDYAPERDVFHDWAKGFQDRDGKFVKEFQLTFQACLWELYLYATLKDLKLPVDFSHPAPDFVVGGATPFTMEAVIAAPPAGGKQAYGWNSGDIPEDLNKFNIDAALRICNSLSYKVKRYREHYATMPHVAGKPFVVALAAFEQPLAHLSGLRPIVAALYGLYHDEEATEAGADNVVSYNVSAAPKNENVNIDLALFCDNSYPEVSAVVYSALATWGKVRGLADNPTAKTIYRTIHPQARTIYPKVLQRLKRDYSEHLLDGLVVLHNPFADHPLPLDAFDHPRVAQFWVDSTGELLDKAPDDFLQVRMLFSITERDGDDEAAASE